MGIFFVDGFTHYATGDMSKKWDALTSANIASSTPRRAGTKYLELGYSESATKNFTAITTIAGGSAIRCSLTTHAGILFQQTGSLQLGLYINVDGSVMLKRGTTALGTSAGGIVFNSVWQYLEWKLVVDNAAGAYNIYLNGVDVLNGSGVDTQQLASADVNQIKLMGMTSDMLYTDLYLADDDVVGDSRIDTLYPDGAGNYSQFDPSAGSNYECVDDPGDIDDDSTYVSTSTVDEIDTYDMDDLSTLAGSTIYALAINNCCRKDDAGTRKFKSVARVNGSDYLGDEETLSDSYHVFQQIHLVNPDDSAAWEEADIDGGEFGLKLTA